MGATTDPIEILRGMLGYQDCSEPSRDLEKASVISWDFWTDPSQREFARFQPILTRDEDTPGGNQETPRDAKLEPEEARNASEVAGARQVERKAEIEDPTRKLICPV